MRKMEILALLFRCDAIIQGYLKNNSFDESKITIENLRKIGAQVAKDIKEVNNKPDTDNFDEYQQRYEGIEELINSWSKAPASTLPFDAIKSADTLEAKVAVINGLTTINDKAKDVLSLIVLCQDEIKSLNAKDDLNDTVKGIINSANADIDKDISAVLSGLSDEQLDELNNKYTSIDYSIKGILGTAVPSKVDIVTLIFNCNKEAKSLLENEDITLRKKDKKYLKQVMTDSSVDYMAIQDKPDKDKSFRDYQIKYTQIVQDISDIKESLNLGTTHRVTRVVPESEVPEPTRKSSKSLLGKILSYVGVGLGAAGLALLIAYLITHAGKKEANKPEPTPSEPSHIEDIEEEKLIAQNIDINNYSDLYNFAISIQTKLPEDLSISIDDIMYALRLANFDKLNDGEKGWFTDRDEVCASTYHIGELAPVIGVDALVQRAPEDDINLTDQDMIDIIMTSTDNALSVDDFSSAKTETGYDIYRVAELCLNGIYQKDEEKAFLYAKVMNELVCREAVNFSVCPNSPGSTHYVIAGMYTANQDRVLELTSGKNLGPIYGTGPRIDGTHGALCVEELAAFMYIDAKGGTYIGNEKNAIYSFVIDENITCYHNQSR